MSSIIERLSEGIVNRDMRAEGSALLKKWERTGLLEGIGDDRKRGAMARLLENQAKELLREASTMSGGSVEGFAAVAFPIVRRVFAGLIANPAVSSSSLTSPPRRMVLVFPALATVLASSRCMVARLLDPRLLVVWIFLESLVVRNRVLTL